MSGNFQKALRQNSHRLLYVGGSHEDFFSGLVLGARGLGFEHCGYLIGVPVHGKSWQFVMMNNFSRSWQERYRRHGFCTIDPTIQYAKEAVLPLTWSSDLFDTEPLSELSKEVKAVGFNHGWTQPLRDSRGRFGVLTLARSQGVITADELKDKLPMMQWLAHVAHSMLFRVLLAKHQNEFVVQLTEREIEFMRLAAEGKTAGDMSALMGVTERTANFHIGNAMVKLSATNKTHAVALAMRLGLLD
jgi:LuxR family quorum-sensing system transcriptional regulator SolR